MNPEPFYNTDSWLKPYTETIEKRIEKCLAKEKHLTGNDTLSGFAMGHHYYGLHHTGDSWIFREWAPNATIIFITGVFTAWKEKEEFRMQKLNSNGDWELKLPGNSLKHGDLYKLSVHWEGGKGERIPSYANRLFQDDKTKIFSAQVWHPEVEYKWIKKDFNPESPAPVIYEAHVGMATTEEKTGTFREFIDNIIPRIKKAGYNTIQLMAIQEHPFYGSFGYHVSSFFAASSRFGTPEELKELVDKAHME